MATPFEQNKDDDAVEQELGRNIQELHMMANFYHKWGMDQQAAKLYQDLLLMEEHREAKLQREKKKRAS